MKYNYSSKEGFKTTNNKGVFQGLSLQLDSSQFYWFDGPCAFILFYVVLSMDFNICSLMPMKKK